MPSPSRRAKRPSLAALAAAALCVAFACGGGNGDESEPSTPQSTPDTPLEQAPAPVHADEVNESDEVTEPTQAPNTPEQYAAERERLGDEFRCVQPDLNIPKTEACARGEGYPACRWQIPEEDESDGLYEIWRNTTDYHRWGRPGLVSLLLAVALEHSRRWPQRLVIGDLDAPGPRHQTHDRGVDTDLYLPNSMIARNEGGRRYPDNYEGKRRSEVRVLREEVMDLAKAIATCTEGQIRIYYNDPDLIHPFREWFDGRGWESAIGRSMRMHNPLHRFHFHITVAEDLDPQAVAE